MDTALGNTTLAEIEILAEVGRFASIRSFARARGQGVASISKTLARLEIRLGMKILRRTSTGVHLTSEGDALASRALRILELASALPAPPREERHVDVLSLGARGYVHALLAPSLAGLCRTQFPSLRLRYLDVEPAELEVAEGKRAIQMAISSGRAAWPRGWVSSQVGTFSWRVFRTAANPAHRSDQPCDHPCEPNFIVPTYWSGKEVRDGCDSYSVPASLRRVGFECQNAMTALKLAEATGDCVCLPELLVSRFGSGRLIPVEDEPTFHCSEPMFLAVNADCVSKRFYDAACRTLGLAFDLNQGVP